MAKNGDWVTRAARPRKRGPRDFERFLEEIVVETLAGNAEVTDDVERAGLAKWRGRYYASTDTADEAGRNANKKYGERFGGSFEWFSESSDEGGSMLYVRFVPDSTKKAAS